MSFHPPVPRQGMCHPRVRSRPRYNSYIPYVYPFLAIDRAKILEEIQRKQALLKRQTPKPISEPLNQPLPPPPNRPVSPTLPPTQPLHSNTSAVNTNQPPHNNSSSQVNLNSQTQAFIDSNYSISNHYNQVNSPGNISRERVNSSSSIQVTQQNSYGYYVTSDSPYGNPILPILPRF